jgi:hypothetical protein
MVANCDIYSLITSFATEFHLDGIGEMFRGSEILWESELGDLPSGEVEATKLWRKFRNFISSSK